MFDVIPAQLCTYQANPTRHSSQRCWCPHRWQILEVVPAENRIRFLVLDCTRALHLSPIFREVSWYKRWSDLRYIYYKYSALKDVNFLVKTKIHTSIHFIPCILYPVWNVWKYIIVESRLAQSFVTKSFTNNFVKIVSNYFVSEFLHVRAGGEGRGQRGQGQDVWCW